MEEESNFMDELQWRQKEPTSYKEIVIEQINVCRKELSKDLREGGMYETMTPKGVFPVYFPDQRDIIIHSVETLCDLMRFFFDTKAYEKIKTLKKNIDGSYDKFHKIYLELETNPTYKALAEKTGIIQKGKFSNVGLNIEKKMINYVIQQYRSMFRELLLLFKRKNELGGVKMLGAYD